MKQIGNFLMKYLSNIFSIIGIILSIYFGVYYVPNWVSERHGVKMSIAQENLEQSVKELIYLDSICSNSEIENLIRAKEIELNQPYPYSTKEVLTLIQESFMQDRFLPLDKRKELMLELEKLKKEANDWTDDQNEIRVAKKEFSLMDGSTRVFFAKWGSIIISLVIGFLGIMSLFMRYKYDVERDEEIENQEMEPGDIVSEYENSVRFEQQIIEIIKNHKGVIAKDNSEGINYGFDLEFEYNNKTYFIEVKYLTSSKVGLKSIKSFINKQKGLEGEFWYIYNTGVTDMVIRETDKWNKISSPNRKVVLVNSKSNADFNIQLNKLLPK